MSKRDINIYGKKRKSERERETLNTKKKQYLYDDDMKKVMKITRTILINLNPRRFNKEIYQIKH